MSDHPHPSLDAPPAAGADAGVPMLRWHHLSSIVCLARGTSVPKGATASQTTNLIHRLDGATDAAFLDACAPDQFTDANGGLFSHVIALGSLAGKETYVWKVHKEDSFPVLLRRDLPGGEPRLGVDGVLLPWPFGGPPAPPTPDGDTLDARYEILQESQNRPAIPSATTSETRPTATLPLTAFMLAVDDAVDPLSTLRQDFAPVRGNDTEALKWIVKQAKARAAPLGLQVPDPLPAGLSVHVEETWTTPETRWEVTNGAPRLRLGWQPPPAVSPMIHQWPCGAFQGFEYGST